MKERVKLYVWLFILLCLSFIGGFTSLLNTSMYIPRNEYLLTAIIGTFFTILLIGSMSFFLYLFLKKRKIPFAVKRTLQFYTLYVIMIASLGIYKFDSTMDKFAKFEFREELDKELNAYYQDTDKDSIPSNFYNYIICIQSEIYENDDLLNRLMLAKDKSNVFQNDMEFKEIEQKCISFIQSYP